MHIIFSSRRQNIKEHQQRPWRRQHRTMSSLLFYASILQIFAHGLNAQLLSEKIPLGKSFRHSYRIALPFLLFGYSVFIVGTYIRIIKKDFLSPLLRCSLFFFISLLLVSVIFISTLVYFFYSTAASSIQCLFAMTFSRSSSFIALNICIYLDFIPYNTYFFCLCYSFHNHIKLI